MVETKNGLPAGEAGGGSGVATSRLPVVTGRTTKRGRWGERLLVLAFYAAVLTAWELLVRALEVPVYLLPPPSAIFSALFAGIVEGQYWAHIGTTLLEAFGGLAIAMGFGYLAAALIVQFRIVKVIFYPLLVGLQSVPKIAIAPLIVIWAGFGIESKLLVAALVAFFPILVNTTKGLTNYDDAQADLFRGMRASRWETFLRLKVPSAMPSFMAGLRVALIFSMLGAIVGEFLGASSGLGYAILQKQFQLDVAGVFAILLILAAIGISGERLIGWVDRRINFWSGQNPA